MSLYFGLSEKPGPTGINMLVYGVLSNIVDTQPNWRDMFLHGVSWSKVVNIPGQANWNDVFVDKTGFC